MVKSGVTILLIAVVSILTFGLISCSTAEENLKNRAVAFYNIFTGSNTKNSLQDFLLPPFRDEFSEGTAANNLKLLREAMRKNPAADILAVNPEEVALIISGRFGATWIEGKWDKPIAQMKPIKWVREGKTWYLYQGSPAQVEKYGPFPTELLPEEPPIPKVDVGEKPEEIREGIGEKVEERRKEHRRSN